MICVKCLSTHYFQFSNIRTVPKWGKVGRRKKIAVSFKAIADNDFLKKMIKFKDYFPAIQLFLIDNDKIYIPTYRQQKEDYELFIYGTNGKFLKQVYFPLKYIDVLQPYPFTIKNNILYQLIENDENEVWELHAVEIK